MTAPAQPLARAGRSGSASARTGSARTGSGQGGPGRMTSAPTPSTGRPAARPAAATAPAIGPQPRRASSRARLAVVRPAPDGGRKGPFVVLLLVLLGAGLLCLLLLNLALMENSFQANTLRNRASALADEEQALSVHADQLSDPASLAAQASRYGMIPGGIPEYLPPGAPLPVGSRTLAREPGSGSVIIVVPASPGPSPAGGPGKTGGPGKNGQPAAGATAGGAGGTAHAHLPATGANAAAAGGAAIGAAGKAGAGQ